LQALFANQPQLRKHKSRLGLQKIIAFRLPSRPDFLSRF
jgi:hypothetical protein